jgi:hypothetical protein
MGTAGNVPADHGHPDHDRRSPNLEASEAKLIAAHLALAALDR